MRFDLGGAWAASQWSDEMRAGVGMALAFAVAATIAAASGGRQALGGPASLRLLSEVSPNAILQIQYERKKKRGKGERLKAKGGNAKGGKARGEGAASCRDMCMSKRNPGACQMKCAFGGKGDD
jgi:hypothetical protein